MHLPPLVFSTITAAVVYNRLFAGCEPAVPCAFPTPPKPSAEAPSSAAKGKGGARPTTIMQRPSGAARRKAITRCRMLRGEIRKWETDFEVAHRRKPTDADKEGGRELYHEYRKLKQIIRDDAATHIQAVFKAHAVRKQRLLPGSKSGSAQGSARSATTTGEGPKSEAQERLNTLKAEKAALKSKLRAYDVSFQEKNGRPPSKAEKEHLRPLYQRYHDLKALITAAEAAVAAAGAAPASANANSNRPAATEAAAPAQAASRASSAGVAAAAEAATPASSRAVAASQGVAASGSGSAPAAAPAAAAAAEAEAKAAAAGDGGGDMAMGDGGSAADSEASAAARAALRAQASTSSGLAELRAEKKKLQHFLRDFERGFEKREGRKVRYLKDIAPVAGEYRRYKDLKAVLKEKDGSSGAGDD